MRRDWRHDNAPAEETLYCCLTATACKILNSNDIFEPPPPVSGETVILAMVRDDNVWDTVQARQDLRMIAHSDYVCEMTKALDASIHRATRVNHTHPGITGPLCLYPPGQQGIAFLVIARIERNERHSRIGKDTKPIPDDIVESPGQNLISVRRAVIQAEIAHR
jgi:hypothetical protein